MVMRSTGEISIGSLRLEFGTHVNSLNQLYYSRAPAADTNKSLGVTDDTIPSSGQISFASFYGKAYKYLELYMTAAAYTYTYITGYTRCFPKGVKVTTKNGLVNIQDLKIDDEVLAINYRTKEPYTDYKKIEKISKHAYSRTEHNEVILKITTDEGDPLLITNNHPVMISNKSDDFELSFTPIENLKVGDSLIGSDLKLIKINNIEFVDHDTEYLYSLEVEDFNTYLVNDFVVHNGIYYKGYYTANYATAYVAATYAYRTSMLDDIIR